MGYHVGLDLCVTRNGESITDEMWEACLNKLNLEKWEIELLRKSVNGEGEVGIRWVVEHKNKFMHTVSSIFPHLEFDLNGIGEESGDIWKETWKAGERIAFKERFELACFM